ncbi:MAG: hypothetical protein AAB855_02500 [Patescibacteria group bacterium]
MRHDRFTQRHMRSSESLFPRVRILLTIGCVGIGSLMLVSLFFSQLFTIEFVDIDAVGGIDVQATRGVVFDQMERTRFWVFPQRNVLVFSRNELEDELGKRFVLRSLSIKKKLPKTIQLALSGEPFRLLHITEGRILDRAPDGGIAADLTERRNDAGVSVEIARKIAGFPSESKELPDVPIVKGDRPLDAETIDFVRSAFERAQTSGYKPFYFDLGEEPTITLHTAEGWAILLSSLDSPATQFSHVAEILDKHFKQERKGLNYIDVRFDNRVYYK